MKKDNIAVSVIAFAVMVLLCGCASNQKTSTTDQITRSTENEESNITEQITQPEEEETIAETTIVENEKAAFSDFFFENQSTFERVVSCLSMQNPPNEEMDYFSFIEEYGLFWTDGFEIEQFVDQQLQSECEILMGAGYRFDLISYYEDVDLGKCYIFDKIIYDRNQWPLCHITILHYDSAEPNPTMYDKLEQLADQWWIGVSYYPDGPEQLPPDSQSEDG